MQVGCADEADTISYLSLTGTLVSNIPHDRLRRLEKIAAPGTTGNDTPRPVGELSPDVSSRPKGYS